MAALKQTNSQSLIAIAGKMKCLRVIIIIVIITLLAMISFIRRINFSQWVEEHTL